MKKITFHIYNYGTKTVVADFKNNSHDAVQCMKLFNDQLIASHGQLPDSIFYYLTYNVKGRPCMYVDFTNGNLYPNDVEYMKKIDFTAELMHS